MKKEYCFDSEGNRYEIGPSLMDMPMNGRIIALPICQACKNEYRSDFELLCSKYDEKPEDVAMSDNFHCPKYIENPDSPYIDMVRQEIELGFIKDDDSNRMPMPEWMRSKETK